MYAMFRIFVLIYCCLALVVYEYVITSRQEIDLIWKRKWSIVTLLFVLNRYVLVANAIVQVAPITSKVRCCPELHFFGLVKTTERTSRRTRCILDVTPP